MLDLLQAAPAVQLTGRLAALIVPHAGYCFSGSVAAVAFSLLAHCTQHPPRRVVLLGPSHFAVFPGASVALHNSWSSPLGLTRIDPGAPELLGATIVDLPDAHAGEHSLEVELPFLQTVLDDFSLLPIVCGKVDCIRLAHALQPCLQPDTLLIASSDLSHYQPYAQACSIDQRTCEMILHLDLEDFEQYGEACGRVPIAVLLYLARSAGWKVQLLEYKNSGDTAGGKERVVGYGAFAFSTAEA